jgi:hypothetical protein
VHEPGDLPTNAASSSLFVTEGGSLLSDDAVESGPAVPPQPSSTYDRAQWHKKLKRVLDELPSSRLEWTELEREAKALELDADWVENAKREEFLLLIRRAVADRVVTASEHIKLDLARELIGIPDAEAEASLHAIIVEAESFFGKPVDEG